MSKKILINIISFKFISELCGMLVAATGIFAIIGWLAGSVILTGIRAVYIPMAPNTAISFILLGTSLAFLITEKRPLHKLSKIGAIVVFALSLFRLAEFSLNITLNVDRWIFEAPAKTLGLMPVGRMALPTAVNFLLASAAIFISDFTRRHWIIDGMERLLAGATTLIGLAFSLGYIYDAPLLYGGTTIPMALNTAISFFVLGLGLVINNLSNDMAERKLAAEALRKAHDELEVRVADRTAELAKAMEITSHLLMIAEATAHTTDIDKLMEQVVRCGHKIMRCDICLSYLWDKETKKFAPGQSCGLPQERIPVFRTEPLYERIEFIKKAMEKKEPLITSLASTLVASVDNGGLSWLPDINTIAVIPLIGKTDYLGLILCIYKSSKEFTERDRKVMQGISHQVSMALEQARLYKVTLNKSMELSNKIETIYVMHEIDRSILSTLESQEIIETVMRLIPRVISCDRATVALVDKERQGFVWQVGFGTAFLPKIGVAAFKDTTATVILETGMPEYIANLADIKGLLPIEKGLREEGFLSHIRMPLTVKGEISAVLTVGSKRPSAFTSEDLSTLEKIASQIGVALSNARLISDLEELFLGTVKALSSAIDAKSPWTAGHSERVTKYAVRISMEMELPKDELKNIELAGILHDLGKIGIYEAILDKPEKLTDEELAIMRQHTTKGAEILSPIKQLKDKIPAIKYHHEFYDGTGYPDGLKGEAIPLGARILAVADTVDAMCADRPYRKGKLMDAIIAELKRCSGTQFDPKVVEAFLKTL